MKVTLNVAALTLNDYIDFEAETGEPILPAIRQLVMNEGQASPEVHRALLWIHARRSNPELTLHQAGKVPAAAIEWTLPAPAEEGGDDG